MGLLVFLKIDSGRIIFKKLEHFSPGFYCFSAFYCEPRVCFGVWFGGGFRVCFAILIKVLVKADIGSSLLNILSSVLSRVC